MSAIQDKKNQRSSWSTCCEGGRADVFRQRGWGRDQSCPPSRSTSWCAQQFRLELSRGGRSRGCRSAGQQSSWSQQGWLTVTEQHHQRSHQLAATLQEKQVLLCTEPAVTTVESESQRPLLFSSSFCYLEILFSSLASDLMLLRHRQCPCWRLKTAATVIYRDNTTIQQSLRAPPSGCGVLDLLDLIKQWGSCHFKNLLYEC